MRQEKEIEFSSDTDNWHTGRAKKGDLFYRTRTVIDGEPTHWKAFLLPACCIGGTGLAGVGTHQRMPTIHA